jgi:hypothetical protein
MPEATSTRVPAWDADVLQITPEHDGLWVVRSDHGLLSTHHDAMGAQRAACALARGTGCTRVLLRDSYGRTHDVPLAGAR